MKSRFLKPLCVSLALAAAAVPVRAEVKLSEAVSLRGALRSGYFARMRTDRDGSRDRIDEGRLRAQIALQLRLHRAVDVRFRLAGRYSTGQDGMSFLLTDHVPTTDGLRFGQSTFDEALILIKPGRGWNVRLGRMQTKYELADVTKKSLDRNDSPNTDVTWTDGAWISRSWENGWEAHAVIQYNSRNGATNVLRSPLRFDDARSRLTWFFGLENNRSWGPVVQRGLHITWIPKSLPVSSQVADGVGDYVAVTAKSALLWKPIPRGPDFVLAGELGYAPNRPSRKTVKTGFSDDKPAGGFGAQMSLNVMNIFAEHNLGLLFGRTGEGWLISPDIRNNNRMVEIRYQWKMSRVTSIEARLRTQTDARRLVDVSHRRTDVDGYVRITRRI